MARITVETTQHPPFWPDRCGNCRSDRVAICWSSAEPQGMEGWFIMCERCGKRGKVASTETAAIYFWDHAR